MLHCLLHSGQTLAGAFYLTFATLVVTVIVIIIIVVVIIIVDVYHGNNVVFNRVALGRSVEVVWGNGCIGEGALLLVDDVVCSYQNDNKAYQGKGCEQECVDLVVPGLVQE